MRCRQICTVVPGCQHRIARIAVFADAPAKAAHASFPNPISSETFPMTNEEILAQYGPREAMEYDVVVVGGGPGGLATPSASSSWRPKKVRMSP
jgi:electron-transferring-flavoprotein dehydrogenase